MLPKKIIEKNRTTILNQDTWFTTNDKFIDRHGRLTIIGRSDDVIISLDGTNINPEDIERQFKFNAIVRCAAIAIRLPSGYDKIILVIGLPSNTSQTSRNEINYKAFEIIKSLPINMKPREIYFTNELPLTNLGKVKRGNIKQSFINSPKLFVKIKNNIDKTKINTQHSAELIKMIDVVRKCYAEVLNLKLDQVSEATDFILDLGGTSLDYYSLISKISMTVGKEIKLVETKTLTTPLDFALLLMKR
jgi:acyl carrier protein